LVEVAIPCQPRGSCVYIGIATFRPNIRDTRPRGSLMRMGENSLLSPFFSQIDFKIVMDFIMQKEYF